ncbi:MAG: CDP-alcohol phosphatidyltransferase family protein [bacterium]|nr:MAG: CDP-alcohol phosphatidyltransferase family protein [bacterium]
MNLPNALTILRILLIPVFLHKVLNGEFLFALVIYIVAAVTDGLDGFIARFWSMQTRLGTFLDPMADKLLVTTSFVSLAFLKVIPLWLALMVITRDVIIVSGSLVVYLMKHQLTVRPHPVSKVTTFFQFLYILMALFLAADPGRGAPGFLPPLYGTLGAVTGLFTVVSGAIYIRFGLRSLED